MQNIINFDQRSTNRTTVNSGFFNEVYYKDNYETQIDIYTFDPAGNQFGVWRLFRAYPISMSDIQLSWDKTNQIAMLSVIFTFQTWGSDFIVEGKLGDDVRTLSTFDYLIRGGNILQTVAGMNTRIRNASDIIGVVNNISSVTRIFSGR